MVRQKWQLEELWKVERLLGLQGFNQRRLGNLKVASALRTAQGQGRLIKANTIKRSYEQNQTSEESDYCLVLNRYNLHC